MPNGIGEAQKLSHTQCGKALNKNGDLVRLFVGTFAWAFVGTPNAFRLSRQKVSWQLSRLGKSGHVAKNSTIALQNRRN
jgi:hypothetical protein